MGHSQKIIAKPHQPLLKSACVHIGWTLLSAVLLLLAFPEPGWGWLVHFALVPVTVLALRSNSPRMLAGCVYVVFSIWWIWMIRWLWPVTGGGEIGLAMFMAAYWTVAILLVRHMHKAYRSAMVITLPMVWVSFELLRGSAPQGGFGWFCLGHALAPYTPDQQPGYLIQIADLFGQPGVSFLVVMTNGLVVDLLTRSLFKPAARGGRRMSRTLTVGVSFWLLSMIGAMGYGMLAFRQEAKSTQQSLSVAVVQTAVPQSNKDAVSENDDPSVHEMLEQQQETNWQQLLAMTRQAAAMKPAPQVIVWPETMVPAPVNPQAVELFRGFVSEDPVRTQQYQGYARYTEQISFLAADLRTNLVVGANSLIYKSDRSQPYSSNSVFVYDWQGFQSHAHYDKMHRVPFGEYIPWVENWPWLKAMFIRYLSPYDFDYSLTPGSKVEVFPLTFPPHELRASAAGTAVTDVEVEGGKEDTDKPLELATPTVVRAVTPICFEDSVPRHVRSMVYNTSTGAKQADVILNLTNDGWFSGTHQPLQHLQIAVFRSIELRVPTARAVNMGVSGMIDSMGRLGPLVEQGGAYQDVPGVAGAVVKIDERNTFYGSAGPWGSILMSISTGILVIAGFFRRRSS